MTVLVLGDAHAEVPQNRESLLAAYAAAGATTDASTALQVGDLGYYDPPTPTWFVGGNNEDFDVIDALRGRNRSVADDDLHLLASSVAEVAGLRVAGLSGNYAPTQYEKSRSELSDDRRRHFVREDVERVLNLEEVDVFLTHEAPHGLLDFGYDPGCEHVDAILDALEPELCLVGHFHRNAVSMSTIDGTETRVVSLAPVWESYYLLDPETLTVEQHSTPPREE